MNSIDKLTELFRQFPGIGPRQAHRFAYFLLTRDAGYLNELTRLIKTIKADVVECEVCHRFFAPNGSGSHICAIDASQNRDHETIMIVARDTDFETVENTKTFNGTYFILGGTVPILEEKPSERIRERALVKLIDERSKTGQLKELIVAMNATPEGDNTAEYITGLLTPLSEQFNFKISTLGRGISTGTELEYSDSETIKNALKNRQ